jgi:lipoyl(octanoyl) transferase
MMLQVQYQNLGTLGYKQAWDYQEQLMQSNLQIKQAQRTAEINQQVYDGQDTTSHFLFVEHPAVFTLGKSGSEANLLANADELAQQNIEYYKTNRGGDITYHGPGQIVGYPILDLEKIKPDIVWYMRTLEDVIIQTLAHFNIVAGRLAGSTGVWLDADDAAKARKICAMGVRTSRWITMHGFALNVNTKLEHFAMIVPCGIQDKGVTSMQAELGEVVDVVQVQETLLQQFQNMFGVEIIKLAF